MSASYKPLSDSALSQLSRILGPDLHQNPAHLLTHSYDATQKLIYPQAVAIPDNLDQVRKILEIVLDFRIPVVPRGAGSGFSGGALAAEGGLVLVLDRLNNFTIDSVNQTATASPGTINSLLDKAARQKGLFYPPDPASREFCTLGGNVAENAGGPRCLKYGVTRDYVLALQAWSPALGFYSVSRFEPPNLLDLLVGSEGTLAVFLEILVSLKTAPTHTVSLSIPFASATQASAAVQSLLMSDLLPARLELLDDRCINAVEDYAHLGLPRNAGAILLVELDGFHKLDEEARGAKEVLLENGALNVTIAVGHDEQLRIWQAREAISPALARIAPRKLNEDVAVSPSKLPLLLAEVAEISRCFGIAIPCFGHAGDGNLHINLMYDDSITGSLEKVEAAAVELFKVVLALGGTISGEHGIGLSKAGFLAMERGEEYMDAMRAAKRAFDPDNLLNPGKMGLGIIS